MFPRGRQHHQLAAKADGAGGDERGVERYAGGVNFLARGHVIGTVEHHIGTRYRMPKRIAFQSLLERYQFDIRVEPRQALLGNLRF